MLSISIPVLALALVAAVAAAALDALVQEKVLDCCAAQARVDRSAKSCPDAARRRRRLLYCFQHVRLQLR